MAEVFDIEVKKRITLSDTTDQMGNRVHVYEENKSAETLEAQHAKVLMQEAGRLYAPIGSDYLGSATVHFYSKSGVGSNDMNLFCACQCSVSKVTEKHADIGQRQLRSSLMACYGRKEPKRRD